MNDRSSKLWQRLSARKALFLIGGPCVIEDEGLCLEIGSELQRICRRLKIPYIFKASYDKANRTSGKSFRGPGLTRGLRVLRTIRDRLGLPVLTDVHSEPEARKAGSVVDVLQIPAFLCRQTDLIEAAVRTGAIVNLKKGQFLSPTEMNQVAAKAVSAGGERLILTERGTTFGYNNLVADMRSVPLMKKSGWPVVFDATHSVQLPGGGGDRSSGQGEFAPVLASAAIAAGADGVFIETHPDPARSPSDGPNMIPLREMEGVLDRLRRIWEVVQPDGASQARRPQSTTRQRMK